MPIQLSFVLPCYNVGRYIADCLDSIFSQDIDESLYEVICVDDCSTDSTREIIVSYCSSHPNLTLIEHEENHTAGGARNTGIENASGGYIWFIDPDDMIRAHSAKELINRIQSKAADIMMFNYEVINEDKTHRKWDNTFCEIDSCSGPAFLEDHFPMQLSRLSVVWRCVFKRTFLIGNNIRFPIMRKAQDAVFMIDSILSASSICAYSDFFYLYRANPYSVGNLGNNATVCYSEFVKLAIKANCLIEKHRVSGLILSDIENIITWHINYIDFFKKMSRQEKLNFCRLAESDQTVILSLKKYMSSRTKRIYRNVDKKWVYLSIIGCIVLKNKVKSWIKKQLLKPIPIFVFHQVSDDFDENSMWKCDWTETRKFKNTILKLKGKYKFISLIEAQKKLDSNSIRLKKYAALTCDDGWKSIEGIIPWLAEQHIPVTLFINPKYLDGVSYQSRPSEKFLTVHNLKALVENYAPFVTIGSHGWSHEKLDNFTMPEFLKSVDDSEKILSSLPGKIPFFAFPFGRHTNDEIIALKEKGLCPVLADGQKNRKIKNNDSLSRICIDNTDL